MPSVINKKSLYLSKLRNILIFKNIHVSNAELGSYSKQELKFLINKLDVTLNNADNPINPWYRTSYSNYQHT